MGQPDVNYAQKHFAGIWDLTFVIRKKKKGANEFLITI